MKIFKHTKQYIFLISFAIFLSLFQSTAYAENETEKNVLILNSNKNYNNFTNGTESMSFENTIISSINSKFIKSKKNINVAIEYMDYNNNLGDTYSQQLYNLYKVKYENTKFDAVITLDDMNDNAFKFMLNYGDKLFPNTPVVFSGVPSFDTSLVKGHSNYTGITKNPDIKSTLDVALSLHPKTKQIFVITDKTQFGIYHKKLVESLIPLYKNKINFLFSDESDIFKLKKEINNLPKDTVIYFSATADAYKGISDKVISQSSAADILFKDSRIPIYCRASSYINNQSIGGMLTYADSYGSSIGDLALMILNGERPSSIPVTEDTAHNYEFNYLQLKKFGIDLKSLPKGSIIRNAPIDYFNIYKNMFFPIAASIIIFIIALQMFLIIFNIYKRRLAENSLSDNENLLNTLINSTPDIIYFKNDKGIFLEINDAALRLLNISRDDYENINMNDINTSPYFNEDLLDEFETNDRKTWETGTIYRTKEVILNRREETNKIYDTLRIPLFNEDGSRKGLMLLGRDITEHKLNEKNKKLIKELKYYDELKTNFFSNISHEFKTPLNLIFSALQIIELKNRTTEGKDETSEKYIDIMKLNCYRLLRIINNLIDITKIDSGNFSTHFKNDDIVFTLENTVMSTVDYVKSKDINITFDTDIEEKVMAFDSDAIERIILNLLSNAIKFTPPGGSIEVNIQDKVDNIVISVKDTGIGIPPDKQASIFKKFVQVDKSLSRGSEGSGIGLSLVKELVVLHNGIIELESAPNKGSEFKITLPVKLLKGDENCNNEEKFADHSNIEKIKIELSDIYV
ncbi:ABC transporter substrate binding protein [Clostridium pasteurianum]|uniref:histidine kinase n=1 Tax=Clostridium pasteurianum BC1 TaxID=86416 RepID=R4JYL9_CLOPA|nr:ABC transporter substrate binding protein [Clostridium pasteurianum]AGK95927.1 PAS domain S-box [Clostridium pasteurianum BC1]